MSTIIQVERNCYLCNRVSKYNVLGSSNTFGSSDLDLRPAPMLRDTMSWWIQECPYCGYVSKSISDMKRIPKNWLSSDEFLKYEEFNFKSSLALKFYKAYLISEKSDNRHAMFYDALHAAWACDDARDIDNSILCRKLALNVIDELIQYEKEDFELVKVDLLRRTEQYDLLIKKYSNKRFSEDVLNKIIEFQIEKASAKDSSCYKVSDVLKN